MTAKQKANQARFKKVVKEAAKLRKKNKKLTQAQAVKQAWSIMYKKPGKKKVAGTSTHKDTKSHNVNIRVVSGVKKIAGYSEERKNLHKRATKEIKRLIKRDNGQSRKDKLIRQGYDLAAFSGVKTSSKKQAVEIKKQLSKKGYKLVHGYKVAKRKSIGALPMYRDQDAAREIELYADNDSQLYYQRRKPILINLAKKYKKGTFDIDKAAKLWRYYIDAAMQKYNKEFGSRGDKWSDLLSIHDRNLLALEYATRTKEEFDLGNLPE